ncbi:MAG: ABC transporter ATP-binding protein [Deltaproteobacteria bacterium]|nr:ABC transporter ATP-binding protein [Deltaproteobacteria bacterium]
MEKGLYLRDVSKCFGGLTALWGVSFSVRDGEIMGIIGPNGAGKTTLFNVISGFLKPDKGEIFFRDMDLTEMKAHQVVDVGIARTFQIVRPFKEMTVFENTMVAALSPRAKRSNSRGGKPESVAMEALERVGLIHRKDDPEEGLPQGDLRRLELARALATNPELIMLDEPFSGLSLGEMEALAHLVQELHAEGRTLLIIEHKLKILMSLVPRVLVLDFGRLIADGSPREIAENEKVIQAYLGKKGRGFVHTGN